MSSQPAIQIKFPHADVAALERQMQRAQDALGKSFGQSVRWAAYNVALSIGKAARVSAKVRALTPIKTPRKKKDQRRTGWKQFDMTYYSGGQERHTTISARGLRDARNQKRAKVENYGLAKASWRWGISKLGKAPSIAFSGPGAREEAQKVMDVQKTLKGKNPSVTITNRLKYAEAALEGGAQTVSSAMERAAKSMMIQIDENVKKETGAK